MVGTGLGARRGVLFKNATALETAARIDTVVMDKTGTLTKGEPGVSDVVLEGWLPEDDLLALVAALERESEHPLAAAIVREATSRAVPVLSATEFRNIPGQGAIADVAGRRVLVGNPSLMLAEGIDTAALVQRLDRLAATGRSAVMVALNALLLKRLRLPDLTDSREVDDERARPRWSHPSVGRPHLGRMTRRQGLSHRWKEET